MFKNIAFIGSISYYGSSQKYTTIDEEVRYDIDTLQNRISSYILIGGSFINANKFTPTFNVGAGNTFWFFQKYGLNLQVMYELSQDKFESQRSHFYTSIGFYRLDSRSLVSRL